MDPRQYFRRYYSKLCLEAFFKSLFCGLSLGFASGFAVALAFWFTNMRDVWIWATLGAFVGITVLCTLLFYFKRFRPNVIDSARRLDSMGLEERLVTMVEYRNDTSFIAQIQRKDATVKLEKVQKKDIKFFFPVKMFVYLAVCAVFCFSMVTVGVLTDMGIITPGGDIIEEIINKNREQYVSVTYIVEEGGYIEGEMDQLVLIGSSAEPVMAVAEEGYTFVEWDDGFSKPSRSDKKIEKEIIVTAVFEPVNGEGDQDGDGDPGGDQEGDQPGDQQGSPGQGEQGQEPSDETGTSGGGKYDSFNQVIDGETYYREVLGEYKEKIAEFLEENQDSLTEEQIAIIKAYIGVV